MDKKSILIIDDDSNLRKVLSDILRIKGYAPTTVATGNEALDRIKEDGSAVALIDLKLEDMSGLDVMRKIKGYSPDTECIVITGYASQASAIEAVNLGAYSYVMKPIDLEQLLVTIHRVTEKREAKEALKESKRRYADIINFLPDATFAIDLEGKVIAWNLAIEEMTGVKAEDMVGKGNYEHTLPFYGTRRPMLIDLTFKSDEEVEKKYSFISKEKNCLIAETKVSFLKEQELILWGKASPIFDHGRNVVGAIQSIRDITERKHAEEEKRKLEAQFQQAQKMEAVGILAGGIAHDFKNALQTISGYTELLLMRKKENDPDRKYLSEIGGSAQRASELIQELLIFSRKVESKLRPVDINQEAAPVERLLKRTLPKMVDVELYLADDIKTINADPIQLEQIMMNLAVNARDVMPDGGRLIIETENTVLDKEYCGVHLGATSGEYVLLTVSDTGCGMDRETLEHIFEPFYTTKEVGKGTGLGLAMVYGIVKSHGGYIMCYSEPGQGTTFKIYFPVLEDEKGIEQIAEREEMEEKIRGNDETILLVDDEKSLLDIGKDVLGQYSYTVVTAESGERAIEVYERERGRIDLVILDLWMPGMGGHKCLEELLKINPDIKVIIASGFSASGKMKEVLEAGAAGFIGKPYPLAGMLKKVREVLDKKM